jgi:hypothetical protein
LYALNEGAGFELDLKKCKNTKNYKTVYVSSPFVTNLSKIEMIQAKLIN